MRRRETLERPAAIITAGLWGVCNHWPFPRHPHLPCIRVHIDRVGSGVVASDHLVGSEDVSGRYVHAYVWVVPAFLDHQSFDRCSICVYFRDSLIIGQFSQYLVHTLIGSCPALVYNSSKTNVFYKR